MTSFSSLPCATKLQVFIPISEHFSSFAMSGLLRRDVLYLRASSRVGSTESKFREHEPRRFVLGRRCVSVAINFVSGVGEIEVVVPRFRGVSSNSRKRSAKLPV